MRSDPTATETSSPQGAEPVLAHLSLDPVWERLTVIEYGRVWDGQPEELMLHFQDDPELLFLLDEPGGSIVGFTLSEPHDFWPDEHECPEIWESPRFRVPVLGQNPASVGEIALAVQGRFGEDEPTADAAFFHMAVNAQEEEDRETAQGYWRMSLEAGDMKAHFGLGYTLVELERYREAYDHLRLYTELTPHNAWAWCWLGKACTGLGDLEEARNAYRRAIEIENRGGFETDAAELLRELPTPER